MKDQKAHREKIRQSLIGRKLSDTHKANISLAMKGKKKSDEHKQKISRAITEYWNRNDEG